MNPFQRARNEALATRAKLDPLHAHTPVAAKDLLQKVEAALNIAIESVPPTYPDLGGGTAVLQREQLFIYVSSEVDKWDAEFCGLVAHEIGHYFLDTTKPAMTVAHLSTLLGSAGSPAVLKVEAYGARERQELQANVFARELLLPRDVARQFALAGKGPADAATELGIPLEFVRQQMLDGLLLPNSTESTSPLSKPSSDQVAAARAEERAANVVAGPGTGKTTTLIHRVKYLLEEKHVHPSQILVLTLFGLHETLLKERRTVDFVDLISKPAIALKDNRAPFVELVDRFQYILVDEYQDVTQAMVELLRQLAHKKHIWVVGDVRQAIHHWRGASLKSLQKFDVEFKVHAAGTSIQRYPLTFNRRSSQEVVDLTQQIGRDHALESTLRLDEVVATNGASGVKPVVVSCRDGDALLGAIFGHISELQASGVPFGSQVVLCRRSSDVERAAALLEQAGLPVIYIGDLTARAEVKHILCLIQLLVERRPKALVGLSGISALNMPLADIDVLLKAAESDVSFQRGRWIHTPPPGLSARGLAVTATLRDLIGRFQHGSNPWAFICHILLDKRFGLPPTADTSVRAWVSRVALWQFAYSVRNGDGEMKEARLSRYLLRQRLRQRISDAQVQRELPPEAAVLDGVRVMSVHGSKGLEFEAVHVGFVSADSYGSREPSWRPEGILDIVPPEALGSSMEEYKFEESVERNNLLYVAVSRAKRHLFLYQDTKFKNSTAPQLDHYPKKYLAKAYSGPSLTMTKVVTSGAFAAPTALPFEDFFSYAICSLRYWYSHVLEMQSESDIDVSLRARWAVMDALKSFASGASGSAKGALGAAWATRKLPTMVEDPSLWSDALYALDRGERQVKALRERGGRFAQASATIGGLKLQMPWGFRIDGIHGGTEYAILRFSRRGVSDFKTIMNPVLRGMELPGPTSMSLHHVLSEKTDKVEGSKAIEMTKAYKAAQRFATGDNSPAIGHHCARCDFCTICPSSPR